MRCGLCAASWLCRNRHRRRACEESGGRAAGCQLCAAGYVQRGPSRTGDSDVVAADAGLAGGSASGWSGGAEGDGFCGSRRWRVSATVVGVIRGGRGIWRTRLLLLPDFESVYGEAGMGAGKSDRDSKTDRRVGVAGFVYRAANSGRQRWRGGAVLPELFPGERSSGLLGDARESDPESARAARARTRARALTTEGTEDGGVFLI